MFCTKNKFPFACCCITAALSGGPAVAVEAPAVVVTATRTAQTVDETIAPVTVFSRADIERSTAQNVPELLRGSPGVDVTLSGGYGKTSSIFLRGTESDHILVLVDGVRIGSATAGLAALEQIPLAQIERVEVVRGPRSSLYGSEAIGGVIQIFTRRADRTLSVTGTAGYGSNETGQVSAGVGGERNGTGYGLHAAYFSTDGIDARQENNTDSDGYDNASLDGRVSHRFGENLSAAAHVFRTQGTNEYDGFDTTADYENDFVQQVVDANLEFDVTDDWFTRLIVAEARDQTDNYTNGTFDSAFDTTRTQVTWQNDTILGEGLLTVGADYVNDEVSGTTAYNRTERDNTGIFGQWQHRSPVHTYAASLRRDDNEQFGGHTTGSLSWGRTLTGDLRFTAAYGTAFKAPSFNELYFPGFGNPDLEPEESDTIDLGLRSAPSWGQWEVHVYRTQVDNLIETVDTGNFIFEPRNVSEAVIEGLEGHVSTAIGAWQVRINASVVDPENRSTGSKLRRRALRTAEVRLDRQWSAWSVGIHMLAQSHRFEDAANDVRLGGYGLVNVRAAYHLAAFWTLEAKLNNLFDKNYELANTYNTLGREALIYLSYHQ